MKQLDQMLAGLRATGGDDPAGADAADASAKEEWAYAAGLAIWMYGLPLMRTERARRWGAIIDAPLETMPFAPINQLGHMRSTPTWESQMAFTPNVDTLYSGAIIELADNPMVFVAPAMPDRYWSLQVADAWYSNQPYLGTRTSGTEAGAWLIVAPGWTGDVPDGLTLYRSCSNTITIALRVRVAHADDMADAVAAQSEFRLTSLDDFTTGSLTPASPGRPDFPPLADHDIAYFTTLCWLLGPNAPYERDAPIVEMMTTLGLTPGTEVDADSIDPAFRRGLVRADEAAPAIIGWKVKHRGTKSPTMWNIDLRGGSFGTDYLARAEGATQGLFVHDPQECTYFHTYHDRDGAALDGSNTYVLHFDAEQIPRVGGDGFWSITGYEPGYRLIRNEHHKYSVQSSDPELERDEQGGVTITIGPTPSGRHANWIATAPGELFRLNLRVYLPEPDMIASPAAAARYLPPVTIDRSG